MGNCPAFRSIRWWRIREFLTNEELLSATSPTYQLLSNSETLKTPYVGSNPGMDFYSVFEKAMNSTRAQLVMWKHLSLFQMRTRKYAHVIRHYFLNNSYIRWASELQQQSISIIYEVLRLQSEMEIETDYLSEMGMFELLAFKKQDKLDFRDVLEILRDKSMTAEDRLATFESLQKLRFTYDHPPKDWHPQFLREFCERWGRDRPWNTIPLCKPPTTEQINSAEKLNGDEFARQILLETFGLDGLRATQFRLIKDLHMEIDRFKGSGTPFTMNTPIRKKPLLFSNKKEEEDKLQDNRSVDEDSKDQGPQMSQPKQLFAADVVLPQKNVYVTTSVSILKSVSVDAINKWTTSIQSTKSSNPEFDVKTAIDSKLQKLLTSNLRLYGGLDGNTTWQELADANFDAFLTSMKTFAETYLNILALNNENEFNSAIIATLKPKIRNLRLATTSNAMNNMSFQDFYLTLEDCYALYETSDRPPIVDVFKTIQHLFQKYGSKSIKKYFSKEKFLKLTASLNTFDHSFTDELMIYEKKYLQSAAVVRAVSNSGDNDTSDLSETSSVGSRSSRRRHKKNRSNKRKSSPSRNSETQTNKKSKPPSDKEERLCWGCGRNGHIRKDCRFKTHPNFNTENMPWLSSKQGKVVTKIPSFSQHTTLPAQSKVVDGEVKKFEMNKSSSSKDKQSKKKHVKSSGNNEKCKCSTLASIELPLENFTISGVIRVNSNFLPIDDILIDSGADIGNVINMRTAEELQDKGATFKLQHARQLEVLDAFGRTERSIGSVDFELTLRKDCSDETFTFPLTAHIVPGVSHNLYICRKTIRDYELAMHLPCQFFHCDLSRGCKLGFLSRHSAIGQLQSVESRVGGLRGPRRRDTKVTNVATKSLNAGELYKITPGAGQIVSKMSLLDYDLATPELDMFLEQERHNPNLVDPVEGDRTDLCRIHRQDGLEVELMVHGTEKGRRCIIKTLQKYVELFRSDLPSEPANLPSFSIDVDTKLWEINTNRTSPRPQTWVKEEEIKRFLNENLELGTIVESDAAYYSQVHLVAKPDKSWRFCIDYRNLNAATKNITNWPLPNIRDMLNRIGRNNGTIFGVMDLKSGYHQIAVDKRIQNLLAFITAFGIYTWSRLPFGPKGAPSFFQFLMCTFVLKGLLYLICEVYIDDVIIYGKDEEDFCANLDKVLKAVKNSRLILNPKKCRFGLKEIEYVGHTLDGSGLRITDDKLRKIALFRKPMTMKEMKSFLGLCNFVREHVRDYGKLTHCLNKMTHNYVRGKPLQWTPTSDEAFTSLTEAIEHAQKLWFYDPKLPVYLYTDASDYCMGAYLFQVKMEDVYSKGNRVGTVRKELPIRFLSKALQGAQLKWKIYDKEGLAIFWAIKECEYILRDIHFTLKTDHANLTYINKEHNERVYRWKLFFQEFDFDVEHVPAKDNLVADYMSRYMVHDIEPESHQEYMSLCEIQYVDVPAERWAAIKSVHNTVVGHHGVERTIKKLLERKQNPATYAEWPEIRTHVRAFIRHCPCCQKMSQLQMSIHTNPFVVSTYYPGEIISIDSLTGLPPTTEGENSVIVIIDNFTRMVELYARKGTTEQDAISALLDHFGRYGVPAKIITDNGSQFVADSITKLYEAVNVEHVRTIAYSKEENSIVERSNKEILRHLRALVYDTKTINNWRAYLPIVQRIMNATVHSATGISPAELLYGGMLDIDRGMFTALPKIDETSTQRLGEYVQKLIVNERLLLDLSQTHQDSVNAENLAKRRKGEPTIYPINSYVLAMYPMTRMGRRSKTKLHTPLKGPFRVIAFNGDRYTVQNEVNGEKYVYHVTQLKPFIHDPRRVNPYDIAMHDSQEYVVERIVSHVGTMRDRYNLRFEVKWLGYEESENTFEPYHELRHNEHLHTYLNANKMRSLIPMQHRR